MTEIGDVGHDTTCWVERVECFKVCSRHVKDEVGNNKNR